MDTYIAGDYIVKEKHAKPFNIKKYQPMLDRLNLKIKEGPVATGAA